MDAQQLPGVPLPAGAALPPSGPGLFPTNIAPGIPFPHAADPANSQALAQATAAALGLKLEAAAAPDLAVLAGQQAIAAAAAAAALSSEAAAGMGGDTKAASAAPTDPEAVAAALAARIHAAGAVVIFEKALTASDVSGGGRVVVPKSVAEQYFPKLEQPSGVTISASDLDGRTYTFKWRFWVNNSSRMYLLEGAGELHRNYGLEVGDVMVFAQRPDGSLVVAGRVASKSDMARKPPLKRPAASGRDARGTSRGPNPAAGRIAATAAADAAAGRPLGVAGGAAGGVGGSGSDRGRKRRTVTLLPLPSDVLRVAGGRADEVSLAVLDMEAPSDGVFRALVMQHLAPVPLGVALARNNRWTATLDVAGELYQAFFDSRDDAVEALTAAGASP